MLLPLLTSCKLRWIHLPGSIFLLLLWLMTRFCLTVLPKCTYVTLTNGGPVSEGRQGDRTLFPNRRLLL